MDQHFKVMAIDLANGKHIQRDHVEWVRGFYACFKCFLDQPRLAFTRLEKERKDASEQA